MHYSFEGCLTARDCKRHIPHRFAVPDAARSGEIEILFSFAPYCVQGIDNLITLTVFDPHGFRGAGHRKGAEHWVHLGADGATPGYLPGPLPAGEWTVQIDTHMIMPGEGVHYRLDVTLTEGTRTGHEYPCTAGHEYPCTAGHEYPCTAGHETAVALQARPVQRPQRGAGWYRGELHSHTHHSDADGYTVGDLIQAARDYGLDFVFLTDHNTIAGLDEMDALSSEDLLTAGGIELTTFWGHALCLGTRAWVDWRVRPGSGDMARIAAATYARDQLFIIAHPQADGDPACTGCAWRYGEMMPGGARLVEVWNGPWDCDSNNEQALALWYDWLNQGLHLVATAGTDTHSAQDYAARPGFNVVYAEVLSETALLEALRAGHLYLSAGPQVILEARNERGERWIMGDTVTQPVTFTATWAGCPSDPAQVRLIANGRLLERRLAGTGGEHEWTMTPDQADWVVVEMRADGGGLLAITNPIWIRTAAEIGDHP